MKKFLKYLGIVLLICGLGMYFIAGKAQEETKPNQVTFGYTTSSGQFVKTDSGYIGGNKEGYNTMGKLKGMGVISAVAGGVLLIGSYKMEEDEPY